MAPKVTINNFLTTFGDAIKNVVKKYNEGLFGLVVALITFGLERLLDEELFNCPKHGYQMYAISFFTVPIVMLTLLNLLTVPAAGNIRIWTLCESCWVPAYWRHGDVFSGFLSALCVGLVAPSAWIFLALLNGQHLVCWELGYRFGDNVTEKYLEDRGFQDLNISQYKRDVDHAKARSQADGVIFLGCAVFCLCLVIIFRRSCLKPFSVHQRLPALWKMEKKEALAASNELKHLLGVEDEDDEYCGKVAIVKHAAIMERVEALEKQKEALNKDDPEDDKKIKEIELEIEEFGELQEVLEAWAEYRIVELTGDEKASGDAKVKYTDAKEKLLKERGERITKAKEALDEYKKSSDAETELDVNNVIFQSWLHSRLVEQSFDFDIENQIKRWKVCKEEMKTIESNLLLHGDHSFFDTPELRGRVVANYIYNLYKNKAIGCQHTEQIMLKFRNIYPRAATSRPSLRYVNIHDPMYQYIIGEPSNDDMVISLKDLLKNKKWTHEKEEEWESEMIRTHKHSRCYPLFDCEQPYCPLEEVISTSS